MVWTGLPASIDRKSMGIHPQVQHTQSHRLVIQRLDHHHQVRHRPRQAVELGDHQHIALTHILQRRLQLGTFTDRSGQLHLKKFERRGQKLVFTQAFFIASEPDADTSFLDTARSPHRPCAALRPQGDDRHDAECRAVRGGQLGGRTRWFQEIRRLMHAGRQGKVLLDFGKRPCSALFSVS